MLMIQSDSIRNVCVIGAGTMGSGIAAHLVNLGFRVSLLDRTIEQAVVGFDRAKMAKPPHFFLPERAAQVTLEGIDQADRLLAEADWVIEAVAEKADIKRAVYEKLDGILRPEAYVSTNTSGLQIADLAAGRSDRFRRRFLGTHFFNPPRYLKLLELIPTEETDPEVVAELTRFLEDHVARRVVLAKDTPGFIANRYGMWSMYLATHVAERLRLTVEQTDAITGAFLGRPKTGTFRLNDLVGFDVMEDIASNLIARCTEDLHVGVLSRPASLNFLMARGFLGEKSGQGYYLRDGKELLSFDLTTHAYRPRLEADLPSLSQFGDLPLGERLQKGLDAKDEVGEYLRLYLVPALKYAHEIRAEISHSVVDFDRVMEWGFGWQTGPFGLIDAIGAERLGLPAQKHYEGKTFAGFDGVYRELEVGEAYRPITEYPLVDTKPTFEVRDLGDGVQAVVITTKVGVISNALISDLTEWFSTHDGPTVLGSNQRSFSVGFDLKYVWSAVQAEDWTGIDASLQALQNLGELLESRSVVAAIHGHALGAGFELARSCAVVVAQADAQIGLPETKVGLIPAGRGCALMRMASQASANQLAEMTVRITEGTVSRNADHARTLGYLRPSDVTTYHPDRLWWDAKQAARSVEPRPRPEWSSVAGPVAGRIDQMQKERMARGEMTAYDEVLGDRLKVIFAKTDSYASAVERERTEFLDVCKRALSQARLRHMVEQKTPLRN